MNNYPMSADFYGSSAGALLASPWATSYVPLVLSIGWAVIGSIFLYRAIRQ